MAVENNILNLSLEVKHVCLYDASVLITNLKITMTQIYSQLTPISLGKHININKYIRNTSLSSGTGTNALFVIQL